MFDLAEGRAPRRRPNETIIDLVVRGASDAEFREHALRNRPALTSQASTGQHPVVTHGADVHVDTEADEDENPVMKAFALVLTSLLIVYFLYIVLVAG